MLGDLFLACLLIRVRQPYWWNIVGWVIVILDLAAKLPIATVEYARWFGLH